MEDQKTRSASSISACGSTASTRCDKKITAAGGSYVTGRKETGPNVYYEVKYKTPEGIVFDVTESGWKGAVKEVKPA